KQDYSYISKREREITAYHEAGHALVTKLLLPDHYISKITIIPSISGVGGFNLSIPKDTIFQSKKQIKANIQVLLAGRIAEELVFGKDEITTGASNDIKKASSLMMDYINKYGMDSDLGIFNSTFVSDLADQKLLEGCRNNMNKLYEETLSLVEDNIKLLKQIANSLLENESIKGEDIDRLIA
ncbi:MAG: cell division protein FtsH, partial [Clostridiales bacterium]|nr:cell division protein FtsH [Clostridiales bacterium]